MAVSVASKTSTSAWTQVFPTETITSISESVKFMKKFAAVGVSTILYLRTNLPDDTFSVKNVDGMRVSLLTPKHKVAKEMCSAIGNGMKALKDGHLRELHLLFYPTKESDDLIEMHKFAFNLPKDRKNSSVGEAGDINNQMINDLVKKSTMKLLRNMSGNLQSFGHLPESVAMSVRLIYDDETPNDYNPPGFSTCLLEEFEKFSDGEPNAIHMGSIMTAWHKVQVSSLTKVDHSGSQNSIQAKDTAVEEQQTMIESPVLNKTSVVDEQETMMQDEDENLAELSTIIALADGLDISQNAGGNSLAREKDQPSVNNGSFHEFHYRFITKTLKNSCFMYPFYQKVGL